MNRVLPPDNSFVVWPTMMCSIDWLKFSHVTFVIIRHPFNGLFSGTTWVSRHQKGQTSLELRESVITSHTEGARWQVQLEPVQDGAMDIEPWWKARKMLWSAVTKAAERSRRHKRGNICDPVALIRWSLNIQKGCFNGMMFTVGKLVAIK